MNPGDSGEKPQIDGELKSIIEALKPYKEGIVRLREVLLWKQWYYPYAIAGIVSMQCLMMWYMDLTIMSMTALICAVLALLDYLLPELGGKLLMGQEWNRDMELMFEDTCNSLLTAQTTIRSYWRWSRNQKKVSPISYTVGIMAVLFMIGLVGCYVNNTFLFYISELWLALLPGLLRHKHLEKLYGDACKQFNSLLGRKPKTY